VFGPVAKPPASIRNGDEPVTKLRHIQSGDESLLNRAARKLLESAHVAGRAYYDAKSDAKKRADYYGNLNLESAVDTSETRKIAEAAYRPIGSYGKARLQFLYPLVDLQPSRKLASVYSGEEKDPSAAIAEELALIESSNPLLIEILGSGVDALRGESARFAIESLGAELDELEATGRAELNCEHVVPQSWFDKQEPMRSDLHHLFACEWSCNSFRGNSPYFDFKDYPDDAEIVVERDGQFEVLIDRQACGRRETDKKIPGFEPAWRPGKAAAARAMLYFLLKYQNVLSGSEAVRMRDHVADLLAWHAEVAPGEWEKHRNAEIQEIQGDRNPLIDFPGAAWQVDHFLGAFAPRTSEEKLSASRRQRRPSSNRS
jgi:endonuclease I